MVEVGRIERPAQKNYANRRKLYFVRSLYLPENAPDEYSGLFNRYWDEVAAHLQKIEAAGKIRKIFCEGISLSGGEALKAPDTINGSMLQIVREKLDEGAMLVPIEEKDVFGPLIDWENCLHIVTTEEVFGRIMDFFRNS